jgi:hypothetical protein
MTNPNLQRITGNCRSCLVPMTDGTRECASCLRHYDAVQDERYQAKMDEIDRYGYPDPDDDPHSGIDDDEGDEDNEDEEEDE